MKITVNPLIKIAKVIMKNGRTCILFSTMIKFFTNNNQILKRLGKKQSKNMGNYRPGININFQKIHFKYH